MTSSRAPSIRYPENDGSLRLPSRGVAMREPAQNNGKFIDSASNKLAVTVRQSFMPQTAQAFPPEFEQIRLDCRQRGVLFTDPTFPPSDAILFAGKAPYPIKWMRPEEISKQYNLKPKFAVDNFQASDLKQGELGDCWVIASLASLLVRENDRDILLPRIVIPGQSFDPAWYSGVFCFRFWRLGKWLDVIVDDLLPTKNGRLLFVHSQQVNEFWGALAEKAYAKINGSYENLKGGQLADALDDFTGGLTESYSLEYNNPNAASLLPPKDIDDIFIKAFSRHGLVGAGIKDKNPNQPMTGTGRVLPNGLVSGHAYTLTDTKKVKLIDPRGERVVTLIRVRNPWGSDTEWNGPWSDESSEWRSIPITDRKNVGLVKGDGEFWMSLEDFLANFDSVDICHIPPSLLNANRRQWAVYEFFGSWKVGTSAGGRPKYQESFWTNPQYKIDLINSDNFSKDGLCTCIIGLQQRDGRRRNYQSLSIGFVLYRLKNSQDTLPLMRDFFEKNMWVASVDFFVNSREVVKRVPLMPGSYVIVPSTYEQHQEGDFLLRVYFENPDNKAEPGDSRLEEIAPTPVMEDPKLTGRMPQILKLMEKEGGKDMALDAYQLHRVLNTLLKDDRFYSELSISACKSLLVMYDRNDNQRIDESEFPSLWNDIYTWIKAFHQYDANNSGTIDPIEMRLLLSDMGFSIPQALLQKLIFRFADEDMSISYSNFISVMALIVKSFATFKRFSKNDRANLSLEEFFTVALMM